MLRSLLVVALVSCVAITAADGAVSIDPYAEQKVDSRRAANDAVELRVKRAIVGGPPRDDAENGGAGRLVQNRPASSQ